jgi:hypothetical protein
VSDLLYDIPLPLTKKKMKRVYLLIGINTEEQLFCVSREYETDRGVDETEVYNFMKQEMKCEPEQILVVKNDEVVDHFDYT